MDAAATNGSETQTPQPSTPIAPPATNAPVTTADQPKEPTTTQTPVNADDWDAGVALPSVASIEQPKALVPAPEAPASEPAGPAQASGTEDAQQPTPSAAPSAAPAEAAPATPVAKAPETETVKAGPIPISEVFQITGASIVGRDHIGTGELVAGTNNQDALLAVLRDDYGLIVVCDGCSEARHSEVGAKIISRLLMKAFETHRDKGNTEEVLKAVQKDVVQQMDALASSLAINNESKEQVAKDYFLCTIMGVFITHKGTFFWGLGDGVYGHNGHLKIVQPAPGNYPPYLAYHLYPEWPNKDDRRDLKVYESLSYHPDSIIVGTDGVKDLLAISDRKFPGSEQKIGSVEQFWKDPKFFENGDELPRALRRIQAIHSDVSVSTREEEKLGVKRIITEVAEQSRGGFLPDDTTLAVLRKNPKAIPGIDTRTKFAPPLDVTKIWEKSPAQAAAAAQPEAQKAPEAAATPAESAAPEETKGGAWNAFKKIVAAPFVLTGRGFAAISRRFMGLFKRNKNEEPALEEQKKPAEEPKTEQASAPKKQEGPVEARLSPVKSSTPFSKKDKGKRA